MQVEVQTCPTKAGSQPEALAPPHDACSAPQCATWTPTDFCSSALLDPRATPDLKRLLTQRTPFRKNDALYRAGDKFNALYAIRTGSCKTVLPANDGQDQIAGYHMAWETIGMDGVGIETWSRLFSRFQHEGLLRVQGRDVKLLDRIALRQLIDGDVPCREARVPALNQAYRLLGRSYAVKTSVRGYHSWVSTGNRCQPLEMLPKRLHFINR